MFHLWVICRKKERRRRTQSGTVCMTFRKEHFAWLKIDYFDLKKITDIIFQKEKKPRHDSFVCPFSAAAAEQSISQHFVYCVVFSIGTYLPITIEGHLKKVIKVPKIGSMMLATKAMSDQGVAPLMLL